MLFVILNYYIVENVKIKDFVSKDNVYVQKDILVMIVVYRSLI